MSTATASTFKQRAHALIDQLPDDATWHDVADALAVIEDIDKGIADGDAGLGADAQTLRQRYGLAE